MATTQKNISKLTSSHTSLTPSAKQLVTCAQKDFFVTKISAGFIKAGLRPLKSGTRRIKIKSENTYLLCSVRGNTSHQEIHIYTENSHETLANIKSSLVKKFSVSLSS